MTQLSIGLNVFATELASESNDYQVKLGLDEGHAAHHAMTVIKDLLNIGEGHANLCGCQY